MKKLVTAAVAVMIMAFSLVTAFAATTTSVESPTASTAPETQATTAVPTPDPSPKSPKTGMNDSLIYSVLALSAVGVGVASVALVKGSKKN